jgi:hypothetical protein
VRPPPPTRDSLSRARLAAACEPIDDATFEAVRDHLGDGGVVELMILAGYYLLVARLATALHVELEPQFQSDTTGAGHERRSHGARD